MDQEKLKTNGYLERRIWGSACIQQGVKNSCRDLEWIKHLSATTFYHYHTHCSTAHISIKYAEREETWGEPKKTTGFFFEEKHRVEWAEEDDGGVEALKHKNRRNISDEEFIPHLIFTLFRRSEQQEITLFVYSF